MILNKNDIFESSARLVTSEPYQSWQDLVMARVRPSQIKTPALCSPPSRHQVVAIALVFVLHASLEQALGSNPIEIISLLPRSKSSVTFIATAISIPRLGSLQWTSSPLLLVLLLPRGSNAGGGRRHRININFHQQAGHGGHGGHGPHQHHQSSPLSLPLTKMALAHLSKLEREKGSRSRGEKASLESDEYSRSEEISQSRSDSKTGPILGHRMMGSESAEGQESEETSESESDSGDQQDESESDSSDQQDESKPSSEYESDSKEDSKSKAKRNASHNCRCA